MIEELIETGQYTEALKYLTDMNDETVRYQRLVCLNALEEYRQLVTEGMNARNQAKTTYYDVLALYLNGLKETEEYEQAIDILIEELSMPYIPMEYETLFNAVYDEILYLKKEASEGIERKQTVFTTDEMEVLLNRDEVNDDLLYMVIDQMEDVNIRRLIPTLRRYLSDPKKPSFAKSLIMEIMIDQQVDEDFEVNKNGSIYDFNPSYAPMVLQQNAYMGIGKHIQRVLEDDNPSLMNQCIDYLEYYLYALYPREIYEENYTIIAAAIHYYVASLQYIDVDEEEIEIDYGVDIQEVENEILALKQIEC